MSSLVEDGKEHLLAAKTVVYRKIARGEREEGREEGKERGRVEEE